MFLEKFKAVFFDVGGTLLRVHPSVGHVYAEHAGPHGFHGSPDQLNERFLSTWKEMGGMESLGQSKGPEIERQFWYDLVKRVFDSVGGLDRFDDYFDHIYQVFESGESWRVYEDVLQSDILNRLKDRGIVLGIISNWDSRLETIIANMGLDKYFDFVLASTVVGSAKPDPHIFQTALKRSGVAPEDACHIGDEIPADIRGAESLGINPILIDRNNRHNDNDVPKRINSFMELV